MKKTSLVYVLLLFVVAMLVGCTVAPEEVNNVPTKFVCYQQGVIVVDTETLNGAGIGRVAAGDYSVRAWIWLEKDGTEKYLTLSDTVSCSQYIVGK